MMMNSQNNDGGDEGNHKNEIIESTPKNRGTGAGGAKTNANGLPYEELTSSENYFKVSETRKFGNKKAKTHYYKLIKLENKKELKLLSKGGLPKYMSIQNEINKECEKYLLPDECFIDEENKVLYILEKKFQYRAGSTDEKLQTGHFKKEYYLEQYPNYQIKYAFVLSDWFKQDKYNPEKKYCKKYNIPIFWGSDKNYYQKLEEWLSSSK